MNKSFEINLPILNKKRLIIYLGALLFVLILDIILFKPIKINKTYAKEDISYLNNIPSINIQNDDGAINVRYDDSDNIVSTYNCNNHMCNLVDKSELYNYLLIYDKEYLIFNYSTSNIIKLNISNIEYNEVKLIGNYLYINDKGINKLFDINSNSFITNTTFEGIVIEDNSYSLYQSDSKYNQTVDEFNFNNELIKHYNHCNSYKNNSKGYCSEHIEGNITNEEVDKQIDIVLSQYPDLNDTRLFLIKSGIEAVGLPYFWGGGHGTLENTLDIANNKWNRDYITITNGFRNQESGKAYPAGLDCAGFVRWLYYISSGVDLYKDHINVISGRNPDVHLIDEKELLPGDIILDKDHVVIYLYKDKYNKPISVHASYDHLQVEISNYKKGNKYYRLNIW
ncbi:MAG: C40 family peptidase [Bacilli bacterium]|nr:C40 family peptidase [Bacilli bacterium]